MDKIKTLLKSKFKNLNTNHIETIIQDIQRHFLYSLKKKWQSSQRKCNRFKKENENWLNRVFTVQLEVVSSDVQNKFLEPPVKRKVGRPEKSFEECCDRAKRYKAKHLRETYPIQQLNLAVKNVSDDNTTREYIHENISILIKH